MDLIRTKKDCHYWSIKIKKIQILEKNSIKSKCFSENVFDYSYLKKFIKYILFEIENEVKFKC